MNRRDFLKGILAAGVAPAFIRIDRLMRTAIPRVSASSLNVGDKFVIEGIAEQFVVKSESSSGILTASIFADRVMIALDEKLKTMEFLRG